MSHLMVRHMNTGGDPDERNNTDYIHIPLGSAINLSTAYALSFWFLMFHVKHGKEIMHNGKI